jgi:putative redox protein
LKSKVIWKEKMQFDSEMSENVVPMDAKPPIGQGKGATPKELLLSAIAACSGMDVVGYLRKHKQELKSFRIESETEVTSGYPAVFKEVHLSFELEGDLLAEHCLEAVRGSQTKYCGVSAMVSKVVPIHWRVVVNGKEVGQGKANFFDEGTPN